MCILVHCVTYLYVRYVWFCFITYWKNDNSISFLAYKTFIECLITFFFFNSYISRSIYKITVVLHMYKQTLTGNPQTVLILNRMDNIIYHNFLLLVSMCQSYYCDKIQLNIIYHRLLIYKTEIITNVTGICSHNPVLSSFVTYHRVCNKDNTTGTTSGAGIAYPSRVSTWVHHSF